MDEVQKYPDLSQEEVDELLGSLYPGWYVLLNKRAYRKLHIIRVYDYTQHEPTRLLHDLRYFEDTEHLSGIYQLVRPTKKETE